MFQANSSSCAPLRPQCLKGLNPVNQEYHLRFLYVLYNLDRNAYI
uniref:Uncharacterized protein n=1 Tax=Arundo donax TaxID=35708 RepID=A0A0A8YD38_ARUDO